MLNVLSVDVEEYFHPEEVQRSVSRAQWEGLPSYVEAQVDRILGILDRHAAQITFFVLGWIAGRHPRVVRSIVEQGHEIGCHSQDHRLVYDLSPRQFREDTRTACARIEDACGVRPKIYRAPSYSITEKSLWALEILAELGFTHDSSVYPISHDRYGIPGFERHAHIIQTASGAICEAPVATVKLPNGRVAPVGGGAYLRLLPYRYTAAGIRSINETERQAACVYFHPWEIDPYQPRLARGAVSRVRTYMGLRGMAGKIERLLREFRFSTLTGVHPFDGAHTAAAVSAGSGSAH
jgi:polysaccharide deacetylase family protein (PEP-CTERM system associated)